MEVAINYWAVLVSGLSSMVLGFIWYSPIVFGEVWMKLSGFSKRNMEAMNKSAMAKMYGLNLIAAFVTAYVLAHFIGLFGSSTAAEGVETAFWIWLGFIAPIMFGSVLWEQKPVKLYLINVSYQLVMVGIMGMILASWV